MIKPSRLHIYPPNGPKTRAYIVGERIALRTLSDALRRAADGVMGMESIRLYANDGHDYEIFITREVTEDEWQTLSNPKELASIQVYDEIRQELIKNRIDNQT